MRFGLGMLSPESVFPRVCPRQGLGPLHAEGPDRRWVWQVGPSEDHQLTWPPITLQGGSCPASCSEHGSPGRGIPADGVQGGGLAPTVINCHKLGGLKQFKFYSSGGHESEMRVTGPKSRCQPRWFLREAPGRTQLLTFPASWALTPTLLLPLVGTLTVTLGPLGPSRLTTSSPAPSP